MFSLLITKDNLQYFNIPYQQINLFNILNKSPCFTRIFCTILVQALFDPSVLACSLLTCDISYSASSRPPNLQLLAFSSNMSTFCTPAVVLQYRPVSSVYRKQQIAFVSQHYNNNRTMEHDTSPPIRNIFKKAKYMYTHANKNRNKCFHHVDQMRFFFFFLQHSKNIICNFIITALQVIKITVYFAKRRSSHMMLQNRK